MDDVIQNRINILKKIKKDIINTKRNNPDLLLELCFQLKVLQNEIQISESSIANLSKEKNKFKRNAEFKKILEEIDSIAVTSIKESELCPITQSKIVDKFVAVCGHVMERSAALNLLKTRKAMCPKIGCNKELKEKK
ncbi:hypothetical protein DMUE_0185 [Dictyocoela muelleri]|nr:hypothetical protein DMUE_0185 [Dictyocoela muelleri]